MSLIEMSFAYERAGGVIESSCVKAETAEGFENGWYDLDQADVDLDDEVLYLDSRCLLERHPDHPNWVIIRDEGDPVDKPGEPTVQGEYTKMEGIRRGMMDTIQKIVEGPIRKEIVWFTPGEIQTALDKDLAAGLRQLADAIEAGAIDGKCIDCQGHGFAPNHDKRAHLLLRIDLAAAVRQTRLEGENNVSGSDQGE